MFIILILERSMSTERFSGTDLNKFSIRPPPVICAAEFIKSLLAIFKISLHKFLLVLTIHILFFACYIFFKIDLTNE